MFYQLAFSLLTVLCSTFSIAQGTEQYVFNRGTLVGENESPVKKISLNHLFRENIELQKYGTCHVYSSTAFLEAGCKMLTGRNVNLSESYFIVKHLRSKIESLPVSDLVDNGIINKIEGGLPEDTMMRFLRGEVKSKEEFSLSEEEIVQEFTRIPQYGRKLNQQYAGEFEKNASREFKTSINNSAGLSNVSALEEKYRKKFASNICTNIDGYFEDCMPKQPQSQNALVTECVQKMQNRIEVNYEPNSEDIVSAIDAGSPVLCVGSFKALNGNIMNKGKIINNINHAFVIYGYRQNNTTSLTEFFVRDSNSATLQPYSVAGCERIISLVKTSALSITMNSAEQCSDECKN